MLWKSRSELMDMEQRRRLCFSLWIFGRLLLHVLGATNDQDVKSLRQISKSWKASQLNWTNYDPCGTYWRGIVCNTSTNSVIKLISNRGDITGTLSPGIGGFASLEVLDLSSNPSLTGDIPREIGQLTNLKFLSLQGCSFTGSVPKELGLLKKLIFLALNVNHLSGTIPAELGDLPLLTVFDIAENQLTGSLPVSTSNPLNIGLDNLTSVVHIHLFNNSLSGTLPKELATLEKLKHLMVENNAITGEIPSEYGNFKSLQMLRIDNNRVSGSIPSTISQIKTLIELYLSNNSLNGTLPDFTALEDKILLIDVGDNIYGPQPFPLSILNLTNLQTLTINNAYLTGTIPDDLFKLPNLESVSLAMNQLSGTVTFPNSLTRLTSINLDNNNISQVLNTEDNDKLSLVGNPVCADQHFHLSCSGIRQMFNATNKTCTLSCFDEQQLNVELCYCAFAIAITLQFNAPTFSVINQDRINTVRRIVINSTRVNIEQVVATLEWAPSHRLRALVYIFPAKGTLMLDYAESETILSKVQQHKDTRFPDEFGPYSVPSANDYLPRVSLKAILISSGAIAGIAVAAVAVFSFIAAVTTYAMFQKRRADRALSKPFTSWGSIGKSDSAPKLKGAQYFSLHELKKATDNFGSASEIGHGGYGKVYKGVLITGVVVAIKKANEGSMQGSGEFKTEIELLSRVHHKNLVSLIGFCYEEEAQMLVYEYMANGSLRDHLAGAVSHLTWHNRIEIALDSARGLTYLHELASPPIIHRDIKSSNILLDQNMRAKVADFGLGKLGINNEGKNHVSTDVKGTLGYMDPEYYMTHQLTDKSDVYSFGVVLLELLTARQPITRGKHIVREVKVALDRSVTDLEGLVDPRLGKLVRSDLIKFADLALHCVDDSVANRPSMAQVVKQLELLINPEDGGSSISRSASAIETSLYDNTEWRPRSQDPEFEYSGFFQSSVHPK